jgi:hypothetical protein
MKLIIENDKQSGPGFAFLKSNDSSIEPGGLKLRVESRDAKPYLGPNGWTSSDATITPSAVQRDGATLVISIGPDVVRYLREATYKVSLIGANGTVESSRVSAKDILMPRANQTGPAAGASAVKQAEVNVGGASIDHVTAQKAADAVAPAAATAADGESVSADATQAQPASGGGNKIVPIAIALVALLVLAGGGYFGYTKLIAPGSSVEALTLDAPETPAASDVENLTPMEQARAFLDEGPAASAMIERAKKFWSDGHGEPGFLVMSRAAKKGDASALIEMAKIYDPAAERAAVPGMPDAKGDIAYNYYRQAQEMGSADAAAAISDLRSWAESAAAEGNRDASVLIRLMALDQ